MSARKKQKLSGSCISDLVIASDSDSDISMSELSESSVESFNDESDDNQIVLPSDWTNTECTRLPFVFQNNSGVQFTVDDNNNPMQFFEKFFDEIVFEHIVNETNLFAKQFFDENVESLPQHSRAHQWYDTCIDEMKTFVALLILLGVDSKARSCIYFTKRESVCSPFYSKVMSGRRFELLQRFMHFADNTSINNESPGRKLAKIQPLLDVLIPIFMKNYIPRFFEFNKNLTNNIQLLSFEQNLHCAL